MTFKGRSFKVAKGDITTVLRQLDIKPADNIDYDEIALRLIDALTERMGEQLEYIIQAMQDNDELYIKEEDSQ